LCILFIYPTVHRHDEENKHIFMILGNNFNIFVIGDVLISINSNFHWCDGSLLVLDGNNVQYMICWIPNHSSSNTQVADSSSPYTGSSVQIRKSQIHLAPIPGQVFKYPSTDSSSSDTGSSGYMVSKYVGKDLFLLELDTPEKL